MPRDDKGKKFMPLAPSLATISFAAGGSGMRGSDASAQDARGCPRDRRLALEIKNASLPQRLRQARERRFVVQLQRKGSQPESRLFLAAEPSGLSGSVGNALGRPRSSSVSRSLMTSGVLIGSIPRR